MDWFRNREKPSRVSDNGGDLGEDLAVTQLEPEFSDVQDNAASDADLELNGEFNLIKRELHQQVIAGMDLSAIGTMHEDELRTEVRRIAEELCRRRSDLLSLSERESLINEVLDEVFGLGPLEPLFRDSAITDILINGPDTVYVERNGKLEPSKVRFIDNEHVVTIVQRIAGRSRPACGRNHANGRRPIARRQPVERDHPSLGAGRAVGLDPPFRVAPPHQQ